MLRAGVIGLGGVGGFHCKGYQQSDKAELVAVCDLMDERLAKTARDYGVDAYKNANEFLQKNDLDIVSICTPTDTHLKLAIKVLRACKHLFLEKPITLNLEDCDILLDEIKKAKVKVKVGIDYEYRVNPVIVEVKQLIDDGRIGKLAAVSLYDWRGPFGRDKYGHWIQKEETSGGMVVEEVCHWFDLLRYFGGEISQVHCNTNEWIHPDFDFEDIAYINLRYKNGAIAHITHSLCGFGYLLNLWIFGTEGAIWAVQKDKSESDLGVGDKDFFGLISLRKHYKPQDYDKKGNLTPKAIDFHQVEKKKFGIECREPETIKESVKHFVDCVITDREFVATAEDGRKSLEIALAARRSAREKTAIELR